MLLDVILKEITFLINTMSTEHANILQNQGIGLREGVQFLLEKLTA